MSNEKAAQSGQGQVESSMAIRRPTRIANPGPVGLFSFAATTFLLSLYNVATRGIHTPNVIVGMALFSGGLLQFLAGMWEFPRGNVFGATALSSYGAFWMSYATIFLPGSGILTAYSDSRELGSALGLYLIVWFMFTAMLIPAVIRRNLAFTLLLILLSITFIVLAAGQFLNKSNLTKGGGITGIMTAIIAYYIAVSELVAGEERPIVKIPQGVWFV